MGRLDGHYGKPLAEDEIKNTMETNRALARWLDRLRYVKRSLAPSPHNTPERLKP